MNKIFLVRAASGIVFGLLMITSVFAGPWSFIPMCFALHTFALDEYFRITDGPRHMAYQLMKILLPTFLLSFFAMNVLGSLASPDASLDLGIWLIATMVVVFGVMAQSLFSLHIRPFFEATTSAFSLFYLTLPVGLLLILGLDFDVDANSMYVDKWFIMGWLILVWTNDTMAYIIGSLIGKHKLAIRISPKKTIEGTIGGVICTVALGYGLNFWISSGWDADWMVMGGIIAVTGTVGDLFESMLKRNYGVKDSGRIMPGHGGFLDRFDAFIFSIPAVYAYIQLS